MNNSEISSFHSSFLAHLQKLFFCVGDLNSWKWSEILEHLDLNFETCLQRQEMLLEYTVKHPRIVKYPVKLSYQQHFLKKFISLLEERGLEVSENLYGCYLELLSQSDDEVSSYYRHFQLPNDKFVTLSEKKSFISDGTTGLCTWQGSFALSEWLIKYKDELDKKTVLELGSGTGLAGLILLSVSKPNAFYFSDCHPQVLKQLHSNIILNIESFIDDGTKSKKVTINDIKDNDLIYWEDTFNESDVKILNLPWEFVHDYDVTCIDPDIIIASDVVYDESLFNPLCNTLENFLRKGKNYALIVCTIRNEITFNNFRQLLEARKFNVSVVPLVPSHHVIFLIDTPVTLLRIEFDVTS